ncbi:uncharacterized protein LOC123695138 [Colias croceus]|uniref:uncharacterized protein LOC123695138 n=1 Tax=Colias crocea TaxID=72248 RepID=UPI001E279E3E|nr:uncharacterized protein LOC123695138 [Colias croceus]
MDTALLQTSIVLHLALQALSQFPAPGQYAYPQMHGQMAAQVQYPMVHAGPMPMMPGQPMPLHAPYPVGQQRMPLVVMPYHSKAADRKYKRRRRPKKKYYKDSSSSSSSSESSSSSKEDLRSRKKKNKHKRKQRQVLTPVISYMTRNGDVVYQKKIKKDNARDWLELSQSKVPAKLEDSKEINDSQEMTMHDLKKKFGLKRNHKHKH